MTPEQKERVEQIRERRIRRYRLDVPVLAMERQDMEDLNFLLSLVKEQEAGLPSDDELVAEMRSVSTNLVDEWYREGQHRDELVDEIAITLTAADRRAEARTFTLTRSICVEKAKSLATAHRVMAARLKGQALGEMQLIRAEECGIVAKSLESVSIQEQK